MIAWGSFAMAVNTTSTTRNLEHYSYCVKGLFNKQKPAGRAIRCRTGRKFPTFFTDLATASGSAKTGRRVRPFENGQLERRNPTGVRRPDWRRNRRSQSVSRKFRREAFHGFRFSGAPDELVQLCRAAEDSDFEKNWFHSIGLESFEHGQSIYRRLARSHRQVEAYSIENFSP